MITCLKSFFSELKIPKPKYRLNINSLNDEKMVHKMVKLLEKILKLNLPKEFCYMVTPIPHWREA